MSEESIAIKDIVKRNIFFFGSINSAKTELARNLASEYTKPKTNIRDFHFDRYEPNSTTYEKEFEKYVGPPSISNEPLQEGDTIWNKENYRDCRGYRPGEMKSFIDANRRPSWFEISHNTNVWVFQLYNPTHIDSKNSFENLYQYCKDEECILLPPKEENKLYNNSPKVAIRLERYEKYMRSVIKPGDFILVPERGRYIKAFGIVSEGPIEELIVENHKVEKFSGQNTSTKKWISRKVEWKTLAREKDLVALFDENFPRQDIITPYREKTTGEIIDIIYDAPKRVKISDVKKELNNDSIQKCAIYITGINEGSKYAYVFRQLKKYIYPDRIEEHPFTLIDSGNIFWLPENLMILGVGHESEGGTEKETIGKQFQIAEVLASKICTFHTKIGDSEDKEYGIKFEDLISGKGTAIEKKSEPSKSPESPVSQS